jgi:hypothetical protein
VVLVSFAAGIATSVDRNRRLGNRENNAGDKNPGNPRSSPVPESKDQKKAGKIRRQRPVPHSNKPEAEEDSSKPAVAVGVEDRCKTGAERAVVVLVYRLPRRLGRSGNLPKRQSSEEDSLSYYYEVGLTWFDRFSLTLPIVGTKEAVCWFLLQF